MKGGDSLRSIMTDNLKQCYYCGSTENIQLHHCIHGNKVLRSASTQYHLLVGLCDSCHHGLYGVHGKYGREKDLKLQAEAQEAWEQRRIRKGKSSPDTVRAEWMEIFGVDYVAALQSTFADIVEELKLKPEDRFEKGIIMTEYIIVGDTLDYEGCLIYTCGGDRNIAEEYLDRIINDPTENDLKATQGMTNLRIVEASEKEQWWNDPFLVS